MEVDQKRWRHGLSFIKRSPCVFKDTLLHQFSRFGSWFSSLFWEFLLSSSFLSWVICWIGSGCWKCHDLAAFGIPRVDKGRSGYSYTSAGLSLVLNYGISRFRAGMGNRLHQQGAWLSFMLFLGIIGGLLSYGPQGFVIGPMAVVLAYGLIRFLSGQSYSNL